MSYTHGPNTDDPAICVNAANDANYFHQDGLGSVGQYGYTGREPEETGMMYYRARYYDPVTWRFTQRDPIGMTDGVNLYAYVANDPINYNDPTGVWG